MSESTEPTEPPGPGNGDETSTEPPAQVKEPSQAELDALPADRRLELIQAERQRQDTERDRRRQSKHQWFNSVGIVIGVLAAVGGLITTGITWRIGQDELRTTREGQVTDRYTKAVEQLGSGKRDVRTAAVYALERIAADSPRDRTTIRDVLAAFVREHDPAPSVKADKLPQEPDTDVHAALAVLGRRPADPDTAPRLDLHAIRVPGTSLAGAALTGANLTGANLADANLLRANLTGANLTSANLTGANLIRAELANMNLSTANLIGANLIGANLIGANLFRTDLTHANLDGARLTRARLGAGMLTDASLFGTDLTDVVMLDVNLSGADLADAKLNRAGLVRTDLTHANLTRADLTDARLLDVNLSGADLAHAKLARAVWSKGTVWPDSVGGGAGIRARSSPAGKPWGDGYFRVRA